MVMIDQVCWNEMAVGDELTLRCTDAECRGYEQELRRLLFQWRHFPVDDQDPGKLAARTLEWQVSSPPPIFNFDEPPQVVGSPYEYGVPGARHAIVAVHAPEPEFAGPATAVPPTATPAPPRILTLIVDPKDALAINYLNRMAEKYPDAVQVTLVLRSAGDTSLVDTPSVTQQYMFENFDIQVPTRLDYGFWGTPVAPTAVPAP